MKIPHKTIERKLFQTGYRYVIGVDEVGMGCLAGPSAVCAVVFTPAFYAKTHRKLNWLRDSKLLLAHQRERFSGELLSNANLRYAVAVAPVKSIDQLNIYQATRRAMRRAIAKLGIKDGGAIVLVDGKTRIEGLPYAQMPIVKGDRKVFAIACASIIAKVYRDGVMKRYAKKYPGYGLEQHKGYGTKLHRERLKQLGPSAIHRRSFRLY